jgi:hypothetical protein
MWKKNKKGVGKVCLCTITTPDYMPGTLVMLHTFFKYNPWFAGDILIYDGNLSENDRALLLRFPRVKFISPPSDLILALKPVFRARPDLEPFEAIFYSLGFFKITGYDKYMYVDGDVFFQSDIYKPLRDVNGLMFSPDRPAHVGRVRDRRTYKMVQNPEKGTLYWKNTFNTGVFFGDQTYFSEDVYKELLGLLQPEYFVPLKRSANDQYLLNRYFENNYTPMSAKYNYRLGLARVLKRKFITLNNAAVIHFSGKKNPWDPEHVLSELMKQPIYLKAFKKWMIEYEDCLDVLAVKGLSWSSYA